MTLFSYTVKKGVEVFESVKLVLLGHLNKCYSWLGRGREAAGKSSFFVQSFLVKIIFSSGTKKVIIIIPVCLELDAHEDNAVTTVFEGQNLSYSPVLEPGYTLGEERSGKIAACVC